MKRSRYTAGQIAFALRQAEEGTSVLGVCRKMAIAEHGLAPFNIAGGTNAGGRSIPRGMT